MKDLHGIDLDLLFDNESEYGEEYRQEELRDEDIYHSVINKKALFVSSWQAFAPRHLPRRCLKNLTMSKTA